MRPISSPTIDLPLVTVLAPALRQMSSTIARASSAVTREVHVAAGRRHALLVVLEIEVEVRERVVLDVARGIAQRLELGQPFRHLARGAR